MLAAITAVLSRCSGLVGSMGAFCKGASGRSIPEIIQGLISCSFRWIRPRRSSAKRSAESSAPSQGPSRPLALHLQPDVEHGGAITSSPRLAVGGMYRPADRLQEGLIHRAAQGLQGRT
jgi:hypothetical protein